ncbi:unnamed protein product, partial [Amoebophrya sp. A120]
WLPGIGYPNADWYLDLHAGQEEPIAEGSEAETTAGESHNHPQSSTSTVFLWFEFLYLHGYLTSFSNMFELRHVLPNPQSLLSYVAIMVLNWMLQVAACKRLVIAKDRTLAEKFGLSADTAAVGQKIFGTKTAALFEDAEEDFISRSISRNRSRRNSRDVGIARLSSPAVQLT